MVQHFHEKVMHYGFLRQIVTTARTARSHMILNLVGSFLLSYDAFNVTDSNNFAIVHEENVHV